MFDIYKPTSYFLKKFTDYYIDLNRDVIFQTLEKTEGTREKDVPVMYKINRHTDIVKSYTWLYIIFYVYKGFDFISSIKTKMIPLSPFFFTSKRTED